MIAEPGKFKKIAQMIFRTRPDEIGCDECFEQMNRLADLVLVGQPATELMPLVQAHLEQCGDCLEEFEALLDALQNMPQG